MKKLIFVFVFFYLSLAEAVAQQVPINRVETIPPGCDPLNDSQSLIYKITGTPGLYYCAAGGTYRPTTLVSLSEVTTDFSSTNQRAVLSGLPALIRRNSTDNFLNGFAFDVIGRYVNPAEDNLPLMWLQYDVDVEAGFRNYTALQLQVNHNTDNAAINGKVVTGISTNAAITNGADIHDAKGILASTQVYGGSRVGSSAGGGAFKVTVNGGAGHADIYNIVVGTGTVSGTDVRSYQLMWLKKPTLTNVVHRDYGEPFAIREDSGFLSRFFGNLKIDNANAVSAGAARVPLTIRLNAAQAADAFKIVAADETTDLFKVSAAGDTTVGGKFYVGANQAPASSTDPCATGQIAWDTKYIYVCVGTDTWRRTTLSKW